MIKKNRKIKVLHICDSFNMGGLENGVVNIINGSDSSGICHEICCIRESGAAADRLNKMVSYFFQLGGFRNCCTY